VLILSLVVPFGTRGMVQVDRPHVLVPLVPRRSEDPLLLVPLVPLRSEDNLLLVPLVPRLQLVLTCLFGCITCLLPTLFSQIFFGFLSVIPKKYWQSDVQYQDHSAVQFTGFPH